jgi:hypothetical protein
MSSLLLQLLLGGEGGGEGAAGAPPPPPPPPPATGSGTVQVVNGEAPAGVGVANEEPIQLALEILDPKLIQAPTSLVAVVAGGQPSINFDFYIDGTLVTSRRANSEGDLPPTSIRVSRALGTKGTHTLTVGQAGAIGAAETFTLSRQPTKHDISVPADASPVAIPGAVQHETRHMVLQDLLPGGLGSYIFPVNPKSNTEPVVTRDISTVHATAQDGAWHLFEGGYTPVEWSFSGYCPTQEMHDKLVAYARLRRRLYLIDHHDRAWMIVILGVQLTARLRQVGLDGVPTDWGHDYTLTVARLEPTSRRPQ